MGLLFNSVMATPTKESKRCHVTSGQTPSDKKRNRPERHGSSSRKSLNYLDSASQDDKENSKVTTLNHTLFFYDYFDISINVILLFAVVFTKFQGSIAKKSLYCFSG